jgi:DNA-binding beta-propeller fold protein YncE
VATGEAPNGAAVDSSTHTVYVPNGVDNNVSVIDTRLCDAADTAGCRHPARTGPEQEYLMVADPATDTIYATDYQLPQIDVLNGTTCRPKHVSGCAAVAEIPIPALVGAIDDSTHTLYASEYTGTNEVAVINTATCNAHDTTGCGTSASTITIGPGPGTPALNPATDTLYVPYGQTGRNVAVVNAATCNADVTSGCGQKPAVVRVGANTPDLAVSSKTDTIYAPSSNTGTVAVINGATCNGTDHSGCGHLAATVTVGLHPFGVAVDDATHTVYVANNTDGDSPGTVSIINAATCNGNDTAGCNAVMPTIEVGRSPLVVALNTRTDTLYVSDYSSAAVSVVNGSTCNATVTRGCRHEAPERAVGSQPFGLAVNPCHGTVYVADILGDGALSIFNGRP